MRYFDMPYEITLRPIGTVTGGRDEWIEDDWYGVTSVIRLDPGQFDPGLARGRRLRRARPLPPEPPRGLELSAAGRRGPGPPRRGSRRARRQPGTGRQAVHGRVRTPGLGHPAHLVDRTHARLLLTASPQPGTVPGILRPFWTGRSPGGRSHRAGWLQRVEVALAYPAELV